LISFSIGCGGDNSFSSGSLSPARIAILGQPVPKEMLAELRPEPLTLWSPKLHPRFDFSKGECFSLARYALPRFNNPPAGLSLHDASVWNLGGEVRNFPESDNWIRVKRTSDLLDVLINDSLMKNNYGERAIHPYLLKSPYGIHVSRAYSDVDPDLPSEFHFGQLGKVLGLCNCPIELPVVASEVGTVKDILTDMFMNYTADEEQEFFAVAAAHYLPPTRRWKNKFGDEFSFDSLAIGLIETPFGVGACCGIHVPIAVASILESHRQIQILDTETVSKCEDYLRRVSQFLTQREDKAGGWSSWGFDVDKQTQMLDTDVQTLLATGHHLEWMSIAKPELCPDRAVIQRAIIRGFSIVVDFAKEDHTFKAQLPLLHFLRAIVSLSHHPHPLAFFDGAENQ
jgi:hypothetical protein